VHPTTRRRLVFAHRWMAIALSPFIAALLVTGAILAFEPLADHASPVPAAPRVDAAALRALVTRVPEVRDATGFVLDESRTVATLISRRGRPERSFSIATGDTVAPPKSPPQTARERFFNRVLRLHKDLWGGIGGLFVTLSSFAIALLALTGPWFAPPGARRGALGWHRWLGWFLWPVLAVGPVSLVLMKMHGFVGGGGSAPMSYAQILDQMATTQNDLGTVRVIQRMERGGAFVVFEAIPGDSRRYLVKTASVTPIDTRTARAGEAMHTGDWAGGWGGMLNLVSAVALLGMLGTGLVSWRRRARAA
jgi:sulfite reductase (NADPH) flavoprotein alpha-component